MVVAGVARFDGIRKMYGTLQAGAGVGGGHEPLEDREDQVATCQSCRQDPLSWTRRRSPPVPTRAVPRASKPRWVPLSWIWSWFQTKQQRQRIRGRRADIVSRWSWLPNHCVKIYGTYGREAVNRCQHQALSEPVTPAARASSSLSRWPRTSRVLYGAPFTRARGAALPATDDGSKGAARRHTKIK